jgi:hypothetical protein
LHGKYNEHILWFAHFNPEVHGGMLSGYLATIPFGMVAVMKIAVKRLVMGM